MATKMRLVTRQFRLQQWTAVVQECNFRPTGMKIADWCRKHDTIKDPAHEEMWVSAKIEPETIRSISGSVANPGHIPGR